MISNRPRGSINSTIIGGMADIVIACMVKMFGNKKPVHISLYSCHGGLANKNINALAAGSTLITFTFEHKDNILNLLKIKLGEKFYI